MIVVVVVSLTAATRLPLEDYLADGCVRSAHLSVPACLWKPSACLHCTPVEAKTGSVCDRSGGCMIIVMVVPIKDYFASGSVRSARLSALAR